MPRRTHNPKNEQLDQTEKLCSAAMQWAGSQGGTTHGVIFDVTTIIFRFHLFHLVILKKRIDARWLYFIIVPHIPKIEIYQTYQVGLKYNSCFSETTCKNIFILGGCLAESNVLQIREN